MALHHPSAIFINKFLDAGTRGRQFNAWFFDSTAHGIGSQSLAAICTVVGKPIGTFFDNVSDPIEGFDIVYKGGATKQAHLGWVWRFMPWHAAFALDAF